MRRRRVVVPQEGSPAWELAAWERECAAGAAAGDAGAAGRLVSARSWLDMLRATGDDPDIGALLAVFARDERAVNGTPAD